MIYPEYKEIFTILAISMGFIANVPYVRGIIRGEVKPHLFSWLIWTIVSGISVAIQYVEGAGIGTWCGAVNTVYFLGVTTASFWYGTKDITRSDWAMLTGALLAIPIWMITKTPLYSVLMIVAIDGIGYYPTIRKSWVNPEHESVFAWGLTGIEFILVILALEAYSLTTYLYPLSLLTLNMSLTIMLVLRRRFLGNRVEQSS